MLRWIKGLFTPKQKLICGGQGCCEVVDSLDRPIAWLYYNRPDSETKMDYIYDVENIANNKSRLKEISVEKNTGKQAYDMVINELCVPYAEKVFVRCKGYVDEEKKSIDNLSKELQFNYLKTYYTHNLVDMVVNAFAINEKVKKKS